MRAASNLLPAALAPAPPTLQTIVGDVPTIINMVASSQDFRPGPSPYDTAAVNPAHNPAWSQSNAFIQTAGPFVAPDGSTSAQKLVETSTNTTHFLQGGAGIPFGNYSNLNNFDNIKWRIAFIAKAAERTRCVCQFIATGNSAPDKQVSIGFDLAGGNVGYDNSVDAPWTLLATHMTPIHDGWWLCTFDIYATTLGTTVRGSLFPPFIYIDAGTGTAARNTTYAGNGSSGILLWWISMLPVGGWSLTQLSLFDDFNDLTTIDVNDTRAPGFNWYTHNLWPKITRQDFGTATNPPSAPTPANAVSISSPSILRLINPAPVSGNAGFTSQLWSAAATGDGSTFVGNTYRPPLLQTMRLTWDPALELAPGLAGTVAWWGLSLEGLIGTSNAFIELDVIEAGESHGQSVSTSTTWNHVLAGSYSNDGFTILEPYVNGVFHQVSTLWLTIAANDGVNGVVMAFMDGVFVSVHDLTYSTTLPPVPAASSPIPQYFQVDALNYVAIMDTAELPPPGVPMFVDFVKIYMNPAPPVVAPVLYTAVGNSYTATTAIITVLPTQITGTIYWVVTLSSVPPTAAQIKAGQDHSGVAATASGSRAPGTIANAPQIFTATGLAGSTTYTAHFVQQLPSTVFSNVISSGTFTTTAVIATTPATIFGTDLVAWFRATDGVFSDAGITPALAGDDIVQQWNDQSGHNYHLSQATSNHRPSYQTTGLNSRPTLGFGQRPFMDRLSADVAMTATAAFSCFVVLSQTSAGTFARSVVYQGDLTTNDVSSTGNCALVINDALSVGLAAYRNSELAPQAIPAATPLKWAAVFDGVNCTTWLNNTTSAVSVSTGVLQSPGNLAVGHALTAGGADGGAQFNGKISEIIIVKRAASSADRAAMDTYFHNKWGTPLFLAADVGVVAAEEEMLRSPRPREASRSPSQRERDG